MAGVRPVASTAATIHGARLVPPFSAAASFAALRLEQLIDHDRRWMGKAARITARELAVLRLVSVGKQTETTARLLLRRRYCSVTSQESTNQAWCAQQSPGRLRGHPTKLDFMTATRTCRGSNHSRRQAAQALARLRPARRPGGNSQAVHATILRRDLCLKPGQRHAAATMTECAGRRGRIATARSGTGSTSGQARSKPGPSGVYQQAYQFRDYLMSFSPAPSPTHIPNLANPELVGDRKRRHTRNWVCSMSVRAKGRTHSHRQASRSHILDSTKQTQDPKSRR